MATEKPDLGKPGWLEQLMLDHDEMKSNTPVVRSRWYVVEYLPTRRAAWNDEYRDWLPSERRRASPYFDTTAEARTWESQHDPGEGAELIVCSENLRTFTDNRWVGW